MIRAPFTVNDTANGKAFYPYQFLDPSLAHEGWFSVAFYVALIAGVVLGAGAGVIWVSRRFRGTASSGTITA